MIKHSQSEPQRLFRSELQPGPKAVEYHAGLVQLAARTANAPIKLKHRLIHLSQNQCRSISQLCLRKCEQSGIPAARTNMFLPSLPPWLYVMQQPHSVEVLSGSSKWIVMASAVDHRQVFCYSYFSFSLFFFFFRDGSFLKPSKKKRLIPLDILVFSLLSLCPAPVWHISALMKRNWQASQRQKIHFDITFCFKCMLA